jgi:hypothetical protein
MVPHIPDDLTPDSLASFFIVHNTSFMKTPFLKDSGYFLKGQEVFRKGRRVFLYIRLTRVSAREAVRNNKDQPWRRLNDDAGCRSNIFVISIFHCIGDVISLSFCEIYWGDFIGFIGCSRFSFNTVNIYLFLCALYFHGKI